MMIQSLRQRLAGYSSQDGEILLFNDTTREILYTVAEHAATGAFSTFKISSYPANFLNAGQCIFAINSARQDLHGWGRMRRCQISVKTRW